MVARHFKNRFQNSKGFSLAEMMVGMGVSLIISLIASFAFMMAFDVYIRTIRQYETETEMASMMYGLRSSLVTATNMVYGGVASAAARATTNRGAVDEGVSLGRIFTMVDGAPVATYSGDGLIVAQFIRERSGSNLAGDLEAVQIVYQRPHRGTRNSGGLYIDTERNPAPGGGWVRVSPVNAPQLYTRLTNFEVNNVKVIDGQGAVQTNTVLTGNICNDAAGNAVSCVDMRALSVEITATMRYFVKGREQDFNWCNRNRISLYPGCASPTSVLFYDLDRKLNIVFSNNAMEADAYLPRRAFGNVYFFAPWLPTQRSP
jgi:prepilin-type N-terminal cleavage/methylation domain-containing protein